MKTLQPLRGFRDLYPQDKASLNFVFDKLREIANLFGYEEYEGHVVEPVDLYTNKTSKELIERQTFQVKGKDSDEQWILRPEMTPSLARMIAQKSGELIFPLKYFNLGLRYRYEAPQKGRSREFYQADYDILGGDELLADVEILSTAVAILKALGFSTDDFQVSINSRRFMEKKLTEAKVSKDSFAEVLTQIDRLDKNDKSLDSTVEKIVSEKVEPESDPYFEKLFNLLNQYGISNFCMIDLKVVRGLDYYTGLVFEIKKKGETGRTTLIGGGRYDNLVADYNPNAKISGVGFAVSDVVLLEYLKDKNLLPKLSPKKTKVLVTVFDETTLKESITALTNLRGSGISAELYPSTDKKLDKQLKYADRNSIPYVAIIGPEEVKKGTIKLKNMKTSDQTEVKTGELSSTNFEF